MSLTSSYFYKKSILLDLETNNTYVKIIVKNEIVTCNIKEIKNDIENKIKKQKININLIIFYVSKYDYELIETDYYWNTMKELAIDNLPIYRKKNDLYEYVNWYNINFNNNNVKIYETNIFTKRKSEFDDQKECLASVKYENTNYKFNKFTQLFYHAGDWDDIERYGLLYVRILFNELYNTVNTMHYMFDVMKKGILVGIKSNKLAIFLPFSKFNYTNDFYDELYFNEDDHKLLLAYKKTNDNKILKKLTNNVYNFVNKNHLNKDIFYDRKKWVANDCFFRNENYEGDKLEALYENMFCKICENRKVNDCVFFVNLRDHPMLRKDLKNAYPSVTDKKIDKRYLFEQYAPIMSICSSDNYQDIPMVTPDDWNRITQKYFPDDCKNIYIENKNENNNSNNSNNSNDSNDSNNSNNSNNNNNNNNNNNDNNYKNKIELIWGNKKPIAIFRGSATGCGITDDDNMRIKSVMLSKEYPELLNAGLTSFNKKIKKNFNKPLEIINPEKLGIKKANFIDVYEKSTYKYILTIDGHVSAYRLSHEFSLGSVILLQESEFYLWFSKLIIPFKHYIPIKKDLSDLIDKIKWCIEHDEECKKIAINGYNFYKENLQINNIYDYMQNTINNVSTHVDKIKDNIYNFNYDKVNNKINDIAIITIYRDDLNHMRLQQKRLFLYYMTKMLKNINNNSYTIIIIEQNHIDKFNIGKLKNIGFDYLTNVVKKKFDNYIFVDIDTIPNSDLLPYYFKTTDGINSLAIRGTRYENYDKKIHRIFLGACVSCTYDIFIKMNGYPNNYIYGWGGEDNDLILRAYQENINTYAPKIGKTIDIETNEKGISKTLREKLDELKQNNEKSMKYYETFLLYELYKTNGINNVNYKILNEFNHNNNIYHVVVNPLNQEYQNEHPKLFEFSDDQNYVAKKSNEIFKLINELEYNFF